MTLSTTISRTSYPGAGSVGPFAFPFRILREQDLRVTKRSALGSETTLAWPLDFTVTGVLNATGSITLATALAAGETIVIRRAPALDQPTSIRNQGSYFPATIEDEFDRLTMQIQSLQDQLDRCFKLGETNNPSAFDLSLPAPTAGKVVTGTGTGFTMSTLDSSAVALPGNGRTVTTLSAYLANNMVFNVKDWLPVGYVMGTTDATTAIQAVIDASKASKYPVVFPPGSYKTTASIVVNDHYLSLIGLGEVSIGPGSSYTPGGQVTYGATIRYTGSGTALLVGVNPGVNGSFISGTHIENLRIEVENGTAIAMRVWHSVHGRFNRIAIFGMKGPTKIGLQVEGGIDNIYEQVDVRGEGQTPGANSTEYALGLRAKLGYLNEIATTTIFRRCYFHLCDKAVSVYAFYDFEDCTFEASTFGVYCEAQSNISLTRCWWEANVTSDIVFNDARVVISGGRLNSYARQDYFIGVGVLSLSIKDVTFTTTHVAPLLFNTGPSAMAATGRCVSSGCTFPAALTVGGSSNNSSQRIQLTDMRKETFRFKAAAVTGSGTLDPMLGESGLAIKWVAPEKGHFLGINVFSSGVLTGGTYRFAVQKNGGTVLTLDTGQIATQRVSTPIPHFQEKFVAGDLIWMYFNTVTLTSVTDFIAEIIVAFGEDGVGL